MSTSEPHELPEHIRQGLFGGPHPGSARVRRTRWAVGAGALVALGLVGLWTLGPALSVPL